MKMNAPVIVAPPRLEADDTPARRRKPEGGPAALTKRHLALLEAMVWGTDDPRVEQMTRKVHHVVGGVTETVERPLRKGEPLELHEAAQLVGIRHRHARELVATHLFHQAYTREIQRMREGAKPAAMQRIIELRDRVGAGKAADAKVQLAAAQAILGDDVGTKSPGIQVNIGLAASPGYIIDLRPDGDDTPLIDGVTYGPAGPRQQE